MSEMSDRLLNDVREAAGETTAREAYDHLHDNLVRDIAGVEAMIASIETGLKSGHEVMIADGPTMLRFGKVVLRRLHQLRGFYHHHAPPKEEDDA